MGDILTGVSGAEAATAMIAAAAIIALVGFNKWGAAAVGSFLGLWGWGQGGASVSPSLFQG
ncbi:capsid protein [Xanthomonas vasicola pv. vasculorum]|nr:capsid protein [Xanthomonas vasicola pv. vasculorum]